MRLAGEADWWAPAPLCRFHERFGFSESEGTDVTDLVLLREAVMPEIDLSHLDLGTERAIRRGDPTLVGGRE